MKKIKWILALALLGIAGIGSAWADHGRVRFGIGIGIGPYWGPGYYAPYGYPYGYPYYYPPVVVAPPAAPPVYVQQAQPAQAPAPQTNYWYYCASSKTYYPYVKECPGGWQQVVPQPSQQ